MIRSHKIRLKPTPEQVRVLNGCCGFSRFSYNFAIREWHAMLDNKEGPKPNAGNIDKKFNALKKAEPDKYAWTYRYPHCVGQQAIKEDFEYALKNFFAKRAESPKEHGRKDGNSFHLTNTSFKINDQSVNISKVGTIKMYESLRFTGKIMNATVSTRAGQWFIAIQVEMPTPEPLPKTGRTIGLDVGVKNLVSDSNGNEHHLPTEIKLLEAKIDRQHKIISRRKKGGKNRQKARLRLQKLEYRRDRLKRDTIHRITTQYVRENDKIGIEDLDVRGMLQKAKPGETKKRKSRRARDVARSSFGEISRQINYKAESAGREVVVHDRYFASSKTCSVCGYVKKDLTLSDRSWTCPQCGTKHDRDENAAHNLRPKDKVKIVPGSTGELTPGEIGEHAGQNIVQQVPVVEPGKNPTTNVLDEALEAGSRIHGVPCTPV